MTISQSSKMLAIKGIVLLQEAIERDFGLKVKMGAELEFRIDTMPGDEQSQNSYSEIMRNDSLSKRSEQNGFFSGSPVVTKMYKEVGPHQFEVVFTHEHQGGPITVGRSIDAAKKLIKRSAEDRKLIADFSPVSPKSYISEDGDRYHTTTGMQTSISLEDQNKRNILLGTYQSIESAQSLAESMLPVLKETMLLSCPAPHSYDRFSVKSEGHPPTAFAVGSAIKIRKNYDVNDGDVGTVRIENRLPGSDAEPYLVVLSTLAATYDALQSLDVKHEGDKILLQSKAGTRVKFLPLTASHANAIDDFTKGNRFRGVLNNVSGEERLGDKFCEAVLEDAKTAHLQPKLESRGRS